MTERTHPGPASTRRRMVSTRPWADVETAPAGTPRAAGRRPPIPTRSLISGHGVDDGPRPSGLPTPAPPAPAPPAPPPPAPPPMPRTSGPTADALRHEAIVRPERAVPSLGWRARMFAATGGLVNVGIGPAEAARIDLVRRVRAPLRGSHRIAVTSIKGGIGKTTVAACLGLALAEHRGDGVVAVDADPDAGTLADRISGTPRSGIRELLADLDEVTTLSRLAAYTSLTGRLRVLAGDQDPAQGEAFRAEEYELICATLARFFDIVITDSGTGLVHSAMQGTLRTADRLVVVGAPTVDGASRAGKTLDWLFAHGHGDLAEHAVLVLCADRISHKVDQRAIREHFAGRCRHVVEVPADPHLCTGGVIDLDRLAPATRDAILELAALVADGFSGGASATNRHPRYPLGK